MSKRFGKGRCAHCLSMCDSLTSDHVFPRSWYPDSTPDNIEKWQMPSCSACNQRHQKIEDDLKLRIGLCLDPRTAEATGLVTRVHRSLNPDGARGEKDRRERQLRRQKFRQIVLPRDIVREDAIYPHFGPYSELAPQDRIPIGIPVDSLHTMARKIVRGATYVLDGEFTSDDQIVVLPPMTDEAAAPILRAIDKRGEWHSIGPGFRFGRSKADGWFAIQIWGQLWIYGVVVHKRCPEEDEPEREES